MRNKLLNFIFSSALIGCFVFSLTGCDDDQEALYEGYGLVKKSDDSKYTVELDNGLLLYPRESYVNLANLHDSTRLYLRFNIMEEQDSSACVKITYADTILTKSILPYSESILDSIGNDPIKIDNAWFAHGFLNFEFLFAGRVNMSTNSAHMVNLLQCESEGETLMFEFRHNDFDDYRDKVYVGVVSFPIQRIVAELKKPVKMKIKYSDSATTSRTIELTYK